MLCACVFLHITEVINTHIKHLRARDRRQFCKTLEKLVEHLKSNFVNWQQGFKIGYKNSSEYEYLTCKGRGGGGSIAKKKTLLTNSSAI